MDGTRFRMKVARDAASFTTLMMDGRSNNKQRVDVLRSPTTYDLPITWKDRLNEGTLVLGWQDDPERAY